MKHIGELMPQIRNLPSDNGQKESLSPRLSPRNKRIIDAAVDIQQSPNPSTQDIAFLTRQLVQVTLPHKNPGDMPTWSRRNGNTTLSIRPGWDIKKNKSVGFPYGSIPRLLLFWITTEALRSKSRTIQLGNSLTAFMRDIGMDVMTGRGKRSNSTRVRTQMNRLIRAAISLESNHVNRDTGAHINVVDQWDLWWDKKQPDQASLFGSYIELGEKFYQAIITAPVPLDRRALKALKKSPLCLDIYSWATYKTYSLSQRGNKEDLTSWETFMSQMGDYSDVKDFKKRVKWAINRIRLVYPALRIETTKNGIKIKSGKPAVSPRTSRQKLSPKPCV